MPLEYFHPLGRCLTPTSLLPLSLLSVSVYVFVEEKKKTSECNYEIHVCVRLPSPPPCCQYVKRCLCASRRHLRALWESRGKDASMIFAGTHTCMTRHTHTPLMLLLLLCFHLLLKSAKKHPPSPPVNTSASSSLKALSRPKEEPV